MFLKIDYNQQIHIFNPKGEILFDSLDKYIQKAFKNLPALYKLTYFDEEKEEITLGCQEDFKYFQHISQNSKTPKLYIKKVDPNKAISQFHDPSSHQNEDLDEGGQPWILIGSDDPFLNIKIMNEINSIKSKIIQPFDNTDLSSDGLAALLNNTSMAISISSTKNKNSKIEISSIEYA